MDGIGCGRSVLDADRGLCRFYLPRLEPGAVTVLIRWRNLVAGSRLSIDGLSLERVGGPDTDRSGVPDWLEHRLDAVTGLSGTVPAVSAVSPVCLEGSALYIDALEVLGSYLPPDTGPECTVADCLRVQPRAALERRWYADVPLAPEAETAVGVSWQQGLRSAVHTVRWVETDVFTAEAVTLRVGDSLLLNADPGIGVPGTAVLRAAGIERTVAPGSPAVWRFDEPGTMPVHAEWTGPDGDVRTAGMSVTVAGGGFAGNPACVPGTTRDWTCRDLPGTAVLEADPGLSVTAVPLDPGRLLRIRLADPLPAGIIARLGPRGPILDAATAEPVVYEAGVTYEHRILQTFEDGSMLTECRLLVTDLPPGVAFHISIFIGGVTFDDGLIDRTVTAADFSGDGEYRYRMIITPEAYKTSVCQTIMLIQDGCRVGDL